VVEKQPAAGNKIKRQFTRAFSCVTRNVTAIFLRRKIDDDKVEKTITFRGGTGTVC
jgi:hypothetical protein